jgi:hypothetical protein
MIASSLPDDTVTARNCGGLGEWFKPAVLKTADGKPSVGSNPTASATYLAINFDGTP